MGFKGILSDSKESGGGGGGRSHRGDSKTTPSSAKSPRGGGGSAATTPGGQLARGRSLTLASPTQHRYGGGGGGRIGSSPGGGRGGLELGIGGGEALAAASGGDGGGGGRDRGGRRQAEPSSPLSLASLSPGRVRSSIGMGGRRLSAWTLGSGTPAAASEALRAEGKQERIRDNTATAQIVCSRPLPQERPGSPEACWQQACLCCLIGGYRLIWIPLRARVKVVKTNLLRNLVVNSSRVAVEAGFDYKQADLDGMCQKAHVFLRWMFAGVNASKRHHRCLTCRAERGRTSFVERTKCC